MKIIFFITLFFSQIARSDQAALNKRIHNLVEQLAQVSNSMSINMCEAESPYFETDQDKEGFKQVVCPNPWDDRNFYRSVHMKYCTERFGTSGFTCVEADPEKIKTRVENVELLDKIKKYATNKFSDYKRSLSKECCADKQACLSRFESVKFRIEPGLIPSAEYESDTIASKNTTQNSIVINYAKLAAAYNTENIDRVIMVELAHACQFALISESEESYKKFTWPTTRCDKDSGLLMFKEGLGEEVSKCLIDEIESQIAEIPEDEKKNFCFGKWYREVFSDMKFRSHFTSPYHWTYDMGRRSKHKNYGSVFKYIKCGFPQDWRDKMCIKDSK